MSSKLQDLNAATELDGTDLVYSVRDPAGTPADRKITKDNLTKPLTLDKDNNKVGVNNASPDGTLQVTTGASGATPDSNSDDLVIENNGNAGMSILVPDGANTCKLTMGAVTVPLGMAVQYTASTKSCLIGPTSAGGSMFLTYGNTLAAIQISNAGDIGIPTANASYKLNITGITRATGYTNTTQALTDGATISINLANGYDGTVTVAGDRTIAAATNITAGGSGTFTITCDGTARTLTWNAIYRLNGATAPSTAFAASSINKVFWHSPDGTNIDIDVIYGV
jgi:hypothetical protein